MKHEEERSVRDGEDELQRERPAQEDHESADQAIAAQTSASVIQRRFRAGEAGTAGPLSNRQASRARRRNPHWRGKLGFTGADFGTAGAPGSVEFAQAVAAYQQQHGLGVDGIAGPKTHHSVMGGKLEGGAGSASKAKAGPGAAGEIPGVLSDADIAAAHSARAAGKRGGGTTLEPGVLGPADVLEPGVLGPADVLESGVLGPADELEGGAGDIPGVLGEGDIMAAKRAKAARERNSSNTMEPGVLGEADALEPGVLGEDDALEPGVLSESDLLE